MDANSLIPSLALMSRCHRYWGEDYSRRKRRSREAASRAFTE